MRPTMLKTVASLALAMGTLAGSLALPLSASAACPDEKKQPSLFCPGDKETKKPSLLCPGDKESKKPSLECPGDKESKKPS